MRQNINTFLQTTYNLVFQQLYTWSVSTNHFPARRWQLCSSARGSYFAGQPAPVIPAGINLFVFVIFSFGGFVLQFQRFSSFDYRYIYKFLYIYIYTFKIDYNIFHKIQDKRVFRWFFNKNEFSLCWGKPCPGHCQTVLHKKCGKFVNSENLGCQHNLKRPISGKATNTQPQLFSHQPQKSWTQKT